MERYYSNRTQSDLHRPRTHRSASLASLYKTVTPTRPEPTASASTRERRHGEKRVGPRSIPHDGATCGNSLCDTPDIATDERLCPGPGGIGLCTGCYKRFKIERRRAKDERRTVSTAWMRPKPRRSKTRTTLPEEVPGPRTASEHQHQDLPSPVDERENRQVDRGEEGALAAPEPRGRDSRKRPTSYVTPTPTSPARKGASLHTFSASSLKEHDRRAPRSSRKHRSRSEKDDRRHTHNSHAREPSTYDEAEFYKYGRWEENSEPHDRRRCGCCGSWSRRRKCVVFGSAILSTIVLIIIIAVAATLTRKKGFNYTPSTAQVNSTLAFASGGGTRKSVNDTDDGIGKGTDTYTYYHGNASSFPNNTAWVSFDSMWTANLDTFKYSCGWLGRGDDNTPQIIQDIYDAIQDRANASLVDHRIILATIIQETNGCPLVPHTTSSGGTKNPGLMQSHEGHTYDAKHSRLSILQMVQDGTQGTEKGWGLVDNLNTYGNPYKAMRGYNSGYIPDSGDLSEKAGATACYVSDIANRLTGWVRAETKCPDDKS